MYDHRLFHPFFVCLFVVIFQILLNYFRVWPSLIFQMIFYRIIFFLFRSIKRTYLNKMWFFPYFLPLVFLFVCFLSQWKTKKLLKWFEICSFYLAINSCLIVKSSVCVHLFVLLLAFFGFIWFQLYMICYLFICLFEWFWCWFFFGCSILTVFIDNDEFFGCVCVWFFCNEEIRILFKKNNMFPAFELRNFSNEEKKRNE